MIAPTANIDLYGQENSPAALLQRAVETSCFGLTLADARQPDCPLVFANRAFERMTGFETSEILGRNCRFLQGPETDPLGVARVREAIRTETASTFLLLNYRKDGSRFWNRFQLSPVHDEIGGLSAFLGIQVDITDDIDRISMENERQKLETLGRLAGGVAHEINNALQPIQLFAEVLDDDPCPDEETRHRCSRGILEQTKFASDVVGQVLSFARRDTQQTETHDVLCVLTEAVDFAAEYVPSSLLIERLGFDHKGPLAAQQVTVNRNALFQVMANLFKNAADATNDKGRITVRASAVFDYGSNGTLLGSFRVSGPEYLAVTITDNGSGIDPNARDHIFEPFFTTKPPGQGTGLGLSTIYGIVERWRGRIEVESELGEGTSFRILIPITSTSNA